MSVRSPKKEVRILLIGDRNVGKTSLILSLVSEEFPIDVPSRAEEIIIPGDLTPEQVPTCIVDYSSVEQDDRSLILEIQRAHVICIVYAVDSIDSIEGIEQHWMPFIQKTRKNTSQNITPIILVGNKVDLVDYSTLDTVLPILSKYEEIETCVECSAKNLRNISEMFYFAQKAVLHPSAPLLNYGEKDLTEKCKMALTRIFKICDGDNDGVLSDDELSRFQWKCFGLDLEPGTLDSLKDIISRNCPGGLSPKGGITFKGFMALHSLFIQRGRHETTWTVLRKFGYNDDLTLSSHYTSTTELHVSPHMIVELSSDGIDFLAEIFMKYDNDGINSLTYQNLRDLFSITLTTRSDKAEIPWTRQMLSSVSNLANPEIFSLRQFLCLWTLYTVLQPKETVQLFAYLGYRYWSMNEDLLEAFKISRDKKMDIVLKKQSFRNVFLCRIFGAVGTGKTFLCRAFLSKTIQEMLGFKSATDKSKITVSNVLVKGAVKYLILEEVDVGAKEESVFTCHNLSADVFCLMYDVSNSKSFEFIAQQYTYISESKIPVLIVANCTNNSKQVRQEYLLQPEAFCARHKLPMPVALKYTHEAIDKSLYVKIATMAAFPYSRHNRHGGLIGDVKYDQAFLLKLSLTGVAFATLALFLILKHRSVL